MRRIVRCRLAILIAACLAGSPSAPGSAAAPSGSPSWRTAADGFASVRAFDRDGTTGGAGGRVVEASTQAELEEYANREEPLVIRVKGAIEIQPKGKEIRIACDKTIVGMGATAEIVGGGFFIGPGKHNIILRNLTIRDTYVEGDWNGKTQDYDGLQIDAAHHVWVDHCHFLRHGDGLLDIRKGATCITVSWCILSDHNKTFGFGWHDKLEPRITIHHTWFRDTCQRNPSMENALNAHLYNNYFQNISNYGVWARGQTHMVLENCYFENVTNPTTVDQGTLVRKGNIFRKCRKGGWPGGADARGSAFFDPNAYYDYRLDAAEDVPKLLAEYAGPREEIGR